ncbi:Gfo/Idh/MocA family oxidoreductase [Intrasporangium sp.]|uniref:Gfo/Idh/MocA family protein n=1 Tax=Intrasporangium sp. TaxID=1925024 RepID=UPI00293A3098|nr:Gfo/Idh/MocA family oxidoreductase [Intrasporangium sp.]MDV3221040.1 Gfo/Idh/MocA family oxidoreductase [Intrasporangium sp.]
MTATGAVGAPLLPEARIPDPREAPAIRWGILGPGFIANEFATAVETGTASSVVAVGSRSRDRARAFAERHGVVRSYGTYDELMADEDVDAVYIASPHSEHHAHALLALEAGKSVLVEKAFTRNASEARAVIRAATSRGLLVAEAMWARYLPHYDVIRQVVDRGLLGDVVLVRADHSQLLHPDGPDRLAAPELAGGALLDLGVYAVSFADHLLGPPVSVAARGTLIDRGVDATVGVVLAYASGAVAVLTSSMLARTPSAAEVVGTEARIELDGPFYSPTAVRLLASDGEVLAERPGVLPGRIRGFSYQAAEFARCLTSGCRECDSMPHAATLRVMSTMDEIRSQIGVRYPGE